MHKQNDVYLQCKIKCVSTLYKDMIRWWFRRNQKNVLTSLQTPIEAYTAKCFNRIVTSNVAKKSNTGYIGGGHEMCVLRKEKGEADNGSQFKNFLRSEILENDERMISSG